MLLQIILIFATSLLASLTITVIYEYARSKIAYIRYKRKLPNVKFLEDDRGWFGNQIDALRGIKGCQAFDERHKKYGDTIGYMVQCLPAISTIDLDLIKRVVIDKACTNINRGNIKLPMKEMETDCIFTCANEQWRRVRRVFAPALKPARFKSPNVLFEIESAVSKLINAIELQMGLKKSSEINAEELIRRYSLQLVLSCLYKQYDMIDFDLSQKCHFTELVDIGMTEVRDNPFFRLAQVMPSLRSIIDWLSYRFHPIGKWRHLILSLIKQQAIIGFRARKKLAELKKQSNASEVDENNFTLDDGTKFRRNMIDYVVEQFQAGKINSSEYMHSSFLLFGAADKTASDSLVYTLYQLAINQELQTKLRDKLKEDGLESEYLGWVINESLRLNPTVPMGCTRTLVAPVELKGGGTLEPGTLLFTNAFSVHRLEKYWGENSEQFSPGRWAQAASFHPAQYIPFGAGLRRCPGREFALFQMKTLVRTIIMRYHLECPIKEDLLEFDSPMFIMNLQKTPLYVKFTKLA